MKKEEYIKLNESIKNYILKVKEIDPYYFINLASIQENCFELCTFLENIPKQPININLKDITWLEIIDISKRILKKISPLYELKFEESINNGIINFIYCDDDINLEENTNESGYQEGHFYINIGLTHTIKDVKAIVHEFFHYLNSNKDGHTTDTRYMLTEFLSTFSEFMVFDDLLENNMIDEYLYLNYYKINDIYRCTIDVLKEADFLLLYHTFGSIDETTYHNIEQFFGAPANQELFEIDTRKMLEKVESNKLVGFIQWQYILGYLYTTYIRKNNKIDDLYLKKIIDLNEIISKYPSDTKFELLKLGIDLNDKDIMVNLLNSTKEKVMSLQKYKEVKSK